MGKYVAEVKIMLIFTPIDLLVAILKFATKPSVVRESSRTFGAKYHGSGEQACVVNAQLAWNCLQYSICRTACGHACSTATIILCLP
jgi:hypothetical protein